MPTAKDPHQLASVPLLVALCVIQAGCAAATPAAPTCPRVDERKLAHRVAMEVLAELRAQGALAPHSDDGDGDDGDDDDDDGEAAAPTGAAGTRARVPTTGAAARGGREPLVTIVEFTDFQCPFCARVGPTMQRLLDEFPDDLRIVVRHNPLPFHNNARPAAMAAAEAQAQQGDAGFFRMHDLLFANQQALERPDLERYAQELRLDLPRFRRALDQSTHAARIDQDAAEAARVNATGTPGFLVNGRLLMGAQPYETFAAMVRSELATARLLMQRGVARSAVAERILAEPNPSPAPDAARPSPRRELDPDTVYRVPASAAPARGPADALVTVVVFSDFQCPFCSRLAPTLQQLRDQYRRDLRIVFRHNPLPFHDNAMPAAEAAAEAFAQLGDAGFWAMHDLLFANQQALERADLERYAQQAGLNLRDFRRALDDHRHQAAIQRDMALAQSIGASGTPASFVNGRRLSGAQPLSAFQELVDARLTEARDRIAHGTPRRGVYDAITRSGATAPVYLP